MATRTNKTSLSDRLLENFVFLNEKMGKKIPDMYRCFHSVFKKQKTTTEQTTKMRMSVYKGQAGWGCEQPGPEGSWN